MTVALPVAVKLLHKGNAELSRSISSYLSLAAIHSAPLLAQYTHTIVDSVIAGTVLRQGQAQSCDNTVLAGTVLQQTVL